MHTSIDCKRLTSQDSHLQLFEVMIVNVLTTGTPPSKQNVQICNFKIELCILFPIKTSPRIKITFALKESGPCTKLH